MSQSRDNWCGHTFAWWSVCPPSHCPRCGTALPTIGTSGGGPSTVTYTNSTRTNQTGGEWT